MDATVAGKKRAKPLAPFGPVHPLGSTTRISLPAAYHVPIACHGAPDRAMAMHGLKPLPREITRIAVSTAPHFERGLFGSIDLSPSLGEPMIFSRDSTWRGR